LTIVTMGTLNLYSRFCGHSGLLALQQVRYNIRDPAAREGF
jgi:hypothetical protein